MGCQVGSAGRVSTCDLHATPWMALGAVTIEDPTESTAKQTKQHCPPDGEMPKSQLQCQLPTTQERIGYPEKAMRIASVEQTELGDIM